MFTVVVVMETLSGPLLTLVWLARAVLLCGAALFLLAGPFAHKSAGIALLYFAQAVLLTFVIRLLGQVGARALYRTI